MSRTGFFFFSHFSLRYYLPFYSLRTRRPAKANVNGRPQCCSNPSERYKNNITIVTPFIYSLRLYYTHNKIRYEPNRHERAYYNRNAAGFCAFGNGTFCFTINFKLFTLIISSGTYFTFVHCSMINVRIKCLLKGAHKHFFSL